MKEVLFKKLFKKAEKQSGRMTKHGVSKYLEDVFTDDLGFGTNKVTFVRYYEKYIEKNNDRTNNPSTELLNKIGEYIGYKSYEDFVTKLSEENSSETLDLEKELKPIEDIKLKKTAIKENLPFLEVQETKPKKRLKKHQVLVFVSLLIILISVGIFYINQQRWMVWNGEHYVEVKFDTKKYDLDQLKMYKEDRIKYFKKIEPNCDVKYFDENGKVNIWYGKNREGKLEIFTSFGLHPETGKTLKHITKYMIQKYFCKNYKIH
ncbi:MAG: hypothetical protein ACPGTO_10030 [Polaribacter sp.]